MLNKRNGKGKAEHISDTFLQTKLHIPQARPGLVPRPRLSELINCHETPYFTLVSAPARFGKTTLLCNWVRQNQVPAAWVLLDTSTSGVDEILHLAAK